MPVVAAPPHVASLPRSGNPWTVPRAMIDAALTIRVWQREGLEPSEISRQLGCDPSWTAVENAIVIDLLMGSK